MLIDEIRKVASIVQCDDSFIRLSDIEEVISKMECENCKHKQNSSVSTGLLCMNLELNNGHMPKDYFCSQFEEKTK